MSGLVPRELVDNSLVKKTLVRSGKRFKPALFRVNLEDKEWSIKDYSDCSWLFKQTVGRLSVSHEFRIMAALNGIKGLPKNPFVINGLALGYEYVEGDKFDADLNKITPEYLRECERILKEIHSRGYAHLDTGSKGNWLVTKDGQPCLIDFQTSQPLHRFPKKVQRYMKGMDYRGVYKKWLQYAPDDMKLRKDKLRKLNKIRSIWPF